GGAGREPAGQAGPGCGGRLVGARAMCHRGEPVSGPRPGAGGAGSVRVAAVDCGTNSLRMLVADVDRSRGTLTDVERRMEIVRLGEGVDATGRLAPEALARTLRVLRS